MSTKEIRILEVFARIIPNLTDAAKEYLLGVGDGMAIATGISRPWENPSNVMDTLENTNKNPA